MKKNNAKYKIVVLSNLKDSTASILETAINLAKIIDASITFFHVKKPTEIINTDNQLSASRSINANFLSTNKKIQQLILQLSQKHDTTINFSFSFGNVKHEISSYLKNQEPDIIVIGKRKIKSMGLFGDGITRFILNNHEYPVIIASNENKIEANQKISLGILNELKYKEATNSFFETILNNAQEPLKSFKIVKAQNDYSKNKTIKNKKIVEYIFDHNDNIINKFPDYVSKNKINLLVMNRRGEENISKTSLNKIINKLDVSLLLTA